MSMPSSSASSADLDRLVAFCQAHPVPDTDAERLLRHLASGPDAILDFQSEGLVGVIVDKVESSSGCAPFDLVGQAIDSIPADLARRMAEQILAKARALNLGGVEFLIFPVWEPHRAMLESLGFTLAYNDMDMVCDAPDWGVDAPVPEGLSWAVVGEDWADEFFRIQREAFAGIIGLFMPSEDEMRRYLKLDSTKAYILHDGQRGVAILRLTPATAMINAIARDPAHRGRGLGRLALDQARRLLPDRTLNLNVVSSNKTAVDLYRRHGFTIVRDMPVLLRRFGQ
jgi:ribosomal protein S18 acetylase RimI-like enzyme